MDYAQAETLSGYDKAKAILDADLRLMDGLFFGLDPNDPNTFQDPTWGSTYQNLAIDAFAQKVCAWDIPNLIDSVDYDSAIKNAISDFFDAAQQWFQRRRDPLTFDLDGDGIETVAASGTDPILFDHDGDGVKNGTGWVSADDGFLVMDRNGNGTIDNGTELFGDSTPLSGGGTAVDGFHALADQDTNFDGVVNNLDGNWNELRVWRDLNQDGESQTGELLTLDELGISGINVAKTENSQLLANGNQIADLGTFIKTDGTMGTMGEVGDLADVDLAEDTFHREFTDTLTIAAEAEALPDMQGSGVLRDLREATSLSTGLTNLLTQYSQATTRQEQMAMLDGLVGMWAHTGGMATMTARFGGYTVQWETIGAERRDDYIIYVGEGLVEGIDPEWSQITGEWDRKIRVLEAFNGRYFFTLPGQTQDGLSAVSGLTVQEASGGGSGGGAVSGDALPTVLISLSTAQVDLLDQAYDSLKNSVYDALLFQTRFKPVTDLIDLSIGEQGIYFDFTAVEGHFQDLLTQNPAQGISDLIEFNSKGTNLVNLGWQGWDQLETAIRSQPVTPELQAIYDEFHVLVDGEAGYTNTGSAEAEIIVSGDTGDSIYGNGGDDAIFGGAGDDTIYGGAGNDTLDGGSGNDIVTGGSGNDIYLFGNGSGHDTINSCDASVGKTDSILFKTGISSADLLVEQTATDLIIAIKDPNNPNAAITDLADSITIQNAYSSNYRIEDFVFADGTRLSMNQIINLMATDGDDIVNLPWNIEGTAFYGGAGNDTVTTGNGAAIISGDAGDDTISTGSGSDLIFGGTGNDHLEGNAGDDTYVFNIGDGADTIYDGKYAKGHSYNTIVSGSYWGGNDTLKFGAGITAADLLVTQTATDMVIGIKDPNNPTATIEQLTDT
ncbi:MAG: hypothetical protein KKB30_07710, partial [Proteobacteria bacterium]|nr:hypothetical protein [Pseudomonadota bacterium]